MWDQNDLVANRLRRRKQHGRRGVWIHQLFVDEVQDLTMAELLLIHQFCDPTMSFLAGDTAQTIARGVGFRFTTLRTLFHHLQVGRVDPVPRPR